MSLFKRTLCAYCEQPVTFWDWLNGNSYPVGDGKAHVKCRVEPKAGT